MSAQKRNAARPILKLCVLGNEKVGKSALTIQHMQGFFVEDWDPTKEDSYVKVDQLNGIFFELRIQDTAGQLEFVAIREEYIKWSDAFLIVYSVTDTTSDMISSYNSVKEHYDAIKVIHSEDLPILLVANKIDLPERIITTEMGKNKAEELNIRYIETSALTKHNVNEAFYSVCRELLRRPRSQPQDDRYPLEGDKSFCERYCEIL